MIKTILITIGAAVVISGLYGWITGAVRCERIGDQVYMCAVDTRLPPGGPITQE